MRDLSTAGKITVFKTLAISKIVHLALVKTIPNSIIQELNKIQNEFIWKTCNPKIKHDTLCKNFENGGLKNVDIMYKLVSLQCSWIKRLYDNSSHNWKVIPLHMIIQKLGKKFLFYSNLGVIQNKSIIFHNIRTFLESGAATYQCRPIFHQQ